MELEAGLSPAISIQQEAVREGLYILADSYPEVPPHCPPGQAAVHSHRPCGCCRWCPLCIKKDDSECTVINVANKTGVKLFHFDI